MRLTCARAPRGAVRDRTGSWVNSLQCSVNSACRGNGGSGALAAAAMAAAGNAVASGAISGPIRNILVITCAKVTPMHLPDAHARAPGNYTALSDLV